NRHRRFSVAVDSKSSLATTAISPKMGSMVSNVSLSILLLHSVHAAQKLHRVHFGPPQDTELHGALEARWPDRRFSLWVNIRQIPLIRPRRSELSLRYLPVNRGRKYAEINEHRGRRLGRDRQNLALHRLSGSGNGIHSPRCPDLCPDDCREGNGRPDVGADRSNHRLGGWRRLRGRGLQSTLRGLGPPGVPGADDLSLPRVHVLEYCEHPGPA